MLRGVHLFRARNINAPLSTGSPLPDPNFLLIREVESSASLWSHALITTFQGRLSRFIKIKAQYTFSHATDDTNDVFDLPANNYDLRPEWGRATFDRRHRSEEHTSELQSPCNLVCRLLLEKKKKNRINTLT